MNSYDYIIVGAGSAGCVLANKLSADGRNSVLVLEAGPMDRDLMIHVPAGVYKAYRDPKINWNYMTEDEPELFDRNVSMPRGKVVGGSSSINSMVYMRGHPLDYDRWAGEHGLTEWRFANCLPYFKAGETSSRGADDWRGGDGPLGVTKGSFENPLFDAFLEAGDQAGQGRSEDLNGFQPEGVARLDATKKNGRRCSAAVAHLKPALSRPNLTLLTRAMVQRIAIEGNRASDIVFDHKGERHTVQAEKEVILSGGAINSPQTLMLSGIGPSDHLRAHGIDPVLDLPGVGRNLQDHASIIVQYACTRSFPIHKVDAPWRKLLAGAQWLINRSGIASSNIWEMGGLIRSNAETPYPNLQYHFGPGRLSNMLATRLKLRPGLFHCRLISCGPTSRGHIELASLANPMRQAGAAFQLHERPSHDRREMVEGGRHGP